MQCMCWWTSALQNPRHPKKGTTFLTVGLAFGQNALKWMQILLTRTSSRLGSILGGKLQKDIYRKLRLKISCALCFSYLYFEHMYRKRLQDQFATSPQKDSRLTWKSRFFFWFHLFEHPLHPPRYCFGQWPPSMPNLPRSRKFLQGRRWKTWSRLALKQKRACPWTRIQPATQRVNAPCATTMAWAPRRAVLMKKCLKHY